jgi:DNA-binding transcriptional LysR family regulator
MTIEYFKEFVVLADFLNYTIAAEHLYIAQPVLSRHIVMLENYLDAQLLKRNTKTVELTETGKFFLARIKPIIKEMDELRKTVKLSSHGYIEHIRIGVPYYAINDYLSGIPRKLEEVFPTTKFEFTVGEPNEILNSLQGNSVDIILLSIEGIDPIQTSKLQTYSLFREQLGVFISNSDSLIKKRPLRLADLHDKQFFNIDNYYFSFLWQHIVKLCHESGFEPKGPTLFNQVEDSLFSIDNGDGISINSEHMKRLATDTLSFVKLEDENCYRTVSLLCKKDKPTDMIDKIVEIMKNGRRG